MIQISKKLVFVLFAINILSECPTNEAFRDRKVRKHSSGFNLLRQNDRQLFAGDDDYKSNRLVGLNSPQLQSNYQNFLTESRPARNISSMIMLDDMLPDRVQKRGAKPRKYAYLMSPLSDQVLEVGQDLGSQSYLLQMPTMPVPDQSLDYMSRILRDRNNECRTIKSSIELVKDELIVDLKSPKPNNQLVRTCKGKVEVNRCEGYCSSIVQPSVKSASGFKKDCFCCNEGSFMQIQVRLDDCRSYSKGAAEGLIEQELSGFMIATIDEPTECKCRKCDG